MIGVFGGTFDPIHLGHLRPALDCLQGLGLTQVRFIPLNVAVHRPQPQAAAALRLAMVQAGIAGQPGFAADARELERPGGSYSYDTLLSLRAELGARVPLCLLVGSDAFRGFLDWHRPAEILDLTHLVVMRRPGTTAALPAPLQALYAERAVDDPAALRGRPAGAILSHDVTQVDIASTRIRDLVRRGLSPRFLVPDPVLRIIEDAGLYRDG
jgi:nicotinate-nucleotide adenylyltransferase